MGQVLLLYCTVLYYTVLYCTVLWPRYRYGIFDDTGCGADPLYPSFYRRHGRTLATATTNTGDTGDSNVDTEDITEDTGGNATCSLGAGVGSRYCDPAVDQVAVTPTLQVLCCTELYCAVLYCTVLYCTIPPCRRCCAGAGRPSAW